MGIWGGPMFTSRPDGPVGVGEDRDPFIPRRGGLPLGAVSVPHDQIGGQIGIPKRRVPQLEGDTSVRGTNTNA